MGAVPFQQYDAPAYGAVAVTPNDGTVLKTSSGRPFRGLYVGGAGDVTVRMLDGSIQTFKAVPVGTTLAIQFDQVHATSTTATLMIALY